jgi:WXG100 family type VII secretion target
MTDTLFQLNYDLLEPIAKKLKDEGEEMLKLHSSTRQRVQDIRKEWIGEAAKKFIEEMESELLPALQRLAQALLHSQDVTNEIMKIIQDADDESASYFTNQLAGQDSGGELSTEALDGIPDEGHGTEDSGAGTSEQGLVQTTPASNASSSGTSEETKPTVEDQHQGSGQSEKNSKEGPPEANASPTGGGGGGSTPNQGLQGDLKDMGVGLGDQASQGATADTGVAKENMPDHIYSSGASSPSGGTSGPIANSGVNNNGQSSSASGGSIAAGIASIAGAAAATGKVVKDLKGREENK